MKKVLITEVPRKPRQHHKWIAEDLETTKLLVGPSHEPEFRSCLVLAHGVGSKEKYTGPVAFYHPGNEEPYFSVPSAGLIADYGAGRASIQPIEMHSVSLYFHQLTEDTQTTSKGRLH